MKRISKKLLVKKCEEEETMEVLLLIITVLSVSFAVAAIFKALRLQADNELFLREREPLQKECEKLREANLSLEKTCVRLQSELSAAQKNVQRAEASQLSAKEEWQKNAQMANAELQRRFEETTGKMTEQMKNATMEMLKERSRDFSNSNAESMGKIIDPLRESIEKMKREMNEAVLKQGSLSGALRTQIENVMKMSEAAKFSAEELSRVFKHESKVQGDWGEVVLNELLESQGLKVGVHYEIQRTLRDEAGNLVKTESGAVLRPDVVLHLDEKREVVIDSKVSLSAYFDYVNAELEADRRKFLTEHIKSLSRHVQELSEKDYSAYIKPPKERMDYVIMFVPHSEALWTALREKPNLWRDAMKKNVYIADEQTLYAALRIIELTWTRIAQVKNQQKIFDLAQEMVDRVGLFVKKYQMIGEALDKAQKAYEEGSRKLSPSGKSILQTCQKLKNLGIKNDKVPLSEMDGENGNISRISGGE